MDSKKSMPLASVWVLVISLTIVASLWEHVSAAARNPAFQLGSPMVQTRHANDRGIDRGSAFVFVRKLGDIWRRQAELTASDATPDSRFGFSVSIDGDTAVVGAPGDDDRAIDAGAAYVFARAPDGTWHQQVKLLPVDGEDRDHFGHSVAVSGDTLLIGAPHDDELATDDGAAYVFMRRPDGNWIQERKLRLPATSVKERHFGDSVSIIDDRFLISMRDANNQHASFVSAYVFARDSNDTWSPQLKLNASESVSNKELGVAVKVRGNTAVIGQAGRNGGQGVAYVLTRRADGAWSKEAQLECGRHVHETFGFSVALDDDSAIIGAPSE